MTIKFSTFSKYFQVCDVVPVCQANTSNGNGLDMNKDFKFLTPERVRERIKHIRYDGDPDLHPVRSTEFALLVRILYELAVFINEKVRKQFCVS